MNTKICIKCNKIKSFTDFCKNINSKDGLYCYCKECQKIIAAKQYKANAEKIKYATSAYAKANPEKVKERKAARHAANPAYRVAYNAAYRSANLEMCNAFSSAWAKANPEKKKACSAAYYASNRDKFAAYRVVNKEKNKEVSAAWHKANPESKRISDHNYRARKIFNGGKLSKGLAERLFKLQKGKCPCCQMPLGNNYHLDHIMPLALGGANEDWNMQLLRQTCNNQKSAKHPVDFMRSRGFLI